MSTAPRASVCICTYNGVGRLRSVLEALAAQTAPRDAFEIVVIDNASTDETAAMVNAFFAEHLPQTGRCVHEPVPGLLFARRRAALEAKGEIVCFLDDDNVAAPDFVAQALAAFERYPRAASIGGKVIADWQSPPSPLVEAVAPYALAIVDLGEEPFAFEWIAQGPVGAGSCYRREVLLQCLEDLGLCRHLRARAGSSLVSGDDMALAVRCAQLGWERRYEPSLRVWHQLPAARMTPAYLCRLYEGIGRGQASVRRLFAGRGKSRAIGLAVGVKDFLLWLHGAILGPNRRKWLTPLANVAAEQPALRGELHALEQELLRGRFTDAFAYAFRLPERAAT